MAAQAAIDKQVRIEVSFPVVPQPPGIVLQARHLDATALERRLRKDQRHVFDLIPGGARVLDLGCGDGRIVVTAAQKYGCRGVGYDINPKRIKESLENVEKNNVGNLVRIEQEDIFTLDLSEANVITLYLLPSLNVKLIPQLEKLKPGSRIVSHDFDMRGVKPDKVVKINSDNEYSDHTIYLWTTPLKKEDVSDE